MMKEFASSPSQNIFAMNPKMMEGMASCHNSAWKLAPCTIFSEVHDQAGLCKVKINCCDFTAESFFLTFFKSVLEYSDNEADLLQPRWQRGSIDQWTAPTQWTCTATSNKQGKGLSWSICSLLWVWWKHELVLVLWSLYSHLLCWLWHLHVFLTFIKNLLHCLHDETKTKNWRPYSC